MSAFTKQQLRREKLMVRNQIPLALRQQKETLIFNAFFEHSAVKKSKNIALYYSVKNEVDTLQIIKKLLALKVNVFLPRMDKNNLTFHRVTNLTIDLEFNQAFAVYEPLSSLPVINAAEIELVVVPIVAFDANYFRLGYGKGYYDRFLEHYHHVVLGLAFNEQLVSEPLPIEKHDIRIETIISA